MEFCKNHRPTAAFRQIEGLFVERAENIIGKSCTSEGCSEDELKAYQEAYRSVIKFCETTSKNADLRPMTENFKHRCDQLFLRSYGEACSRMVHARLESCRVESLSRMLQCEVQAFLNMDESSPAYQESVDFIRMSYQNVSALCDTLITLCDQFAVPEARETVSALMKANSESMRLVSQVESKQPSECQCVA
jgi:hypothetical protein